MHLQLQGRGGALSLARYVEESPQRQAVEYLCGHLRPHGEDEVGDVPLIDPEPGDALLPLLLQLVALAAGAVLVRLSLGQVGQLVQAGGAGFRCALPQVLRRGAARCLRGANIAGQQQALHLRGGFLRRPGERLRRGLPRRRGGFCLHRGEQQGRNGQQQGGFSHACSSPR